MTPAVRQVVRAIADGAIKEPLTVDIVVFVKDHTIGLMHPECSEHLPDEGYEFLGRAVLDADRMDKLLSTGDPIMGSHNECDWCGNLLFVQGSW